MQAKCRHSIAVCLCTLSTVLLAMTRPRRQAAILIEHKIIRTYYKVQTQKIRKQSPLPCLPSATCTVCSRDSSCNPIHLPTKGRPCPKAENSSDAAHKYAISKVDGGNMRLGTQMRSNMGMQPEHLHTCVDLGCRRVMACATSFLQSLHVVAMNATSCVASPQTILVRQMQGSPAHTRFPGLPSDS
jgi:hypothetical protein